MNGFHRLFCKSSIWRRKLERDVVPWALHDTGLGENVLEVGSGPGLTTDILRTKAVRLTALEIDREYSSKLAKRFFGTNVTVVTQDATDIQFPNDSFTSAVCMTMLHHVPSADLQNQMFAEIMRVLRPGAVFLGCDRIFRSRFDLTHLFDTKVPVPPESLNQRLLWAGFEKIEIEVRQSDFRFRAWKPAR